MAELSRLSWKWRERSTAKLAEETHEKAQIGVEAHGPEKRARFTAAARAGIRHHGSFHGLNPATLYRTIKYVIVLCLRIARFRLLEPPFPRHG